MYYIKAFFASGFVPDDFILEMFNHLNTSNKTKGDIQMMLKSKICATVFVLYEIIAVLLLHCPYTCRWMFGATFCADSVFKYFIALFAVPALVGLVLMWIMHIIHAIRRRHSFVYRAQEALSDVAGSLKKTLKESVTRQDMEKYIVAALVAGVKKYSDKNPEMKKAFGNIISAITGASADSVSFESDDEDDAPTHATSRTTTRRATHTKSTQKRMSRK
ncbi:hypothetical protein HDR61_00400 [bacterium]|nr:hypothetical protein [bacterium]